MRVLDPVEVVFSDGEQRRAAAAAMHMLDQGEEQRTYAKLLWAVTSLIGGVTAHNNEKSPLEAGGTR